MEDNHLVHLSCLFNARIADELANKIDIFAQYIKRRVTVLWFVTDHFTLIQGYSITTDIAPG